MLPDWYAGGLPKPRSTLHPKIPLSKERDVYLIPLLVVLATPKAHQHSALKNCTAAYNHTLDNLAVATMAANGADQLAIVMAWENSVLDSYEKLSKHPEAASSLCSSGSLAILSGIDTNLKTKGLLTPPPTPPPTAPTEIILPRDYRRYEL